MADLMEKTRLLAELHGHKMPANAQAVVEQAKEVFGDVRVTMKEKEEPQITPKRTSMITESDVSKAMEWLVSNADKAADARATRLYLEDFTRAIKAEIMGEHIDEPVNAQERHAYSDPRYKTHLDGLRVAIKEDEKFRWLNGCAQTKIDIWRTTQANLRRV